MAPCAFAAASWSTSVCSLVTVGLAYPWRNVASLLLRNDIASSPKCGLHEEERERCLWRHLNIVVKARLRYVCILPATQDTGASLISVYHGSSDQSAQNRCQMEPKEIQLPTNSSKCLIASPPLSSCRMTNPSTSFSERSYHLLLLVCGVIECHLQSPNK